MEFAHERHRIAYERTAEYLGELFEADDLDRDSEDGHWYVRYGSTVLEISVDPYGPEDATVQVMAYCVQGVTVDESLMRNLLRLNHDLTFGAFSLVGKDVFFAHTLFGRTLERSNLLGAIAAVADIADDYDDRIADHWHGHRALDRIRHTGGRKKRLAAVKEN